MLKFDEVQGVVRIEYINDDGWMENVFVVSGLLDEESICLDYKSMCDMRDLLNMAIKAAQAHGLDGGTE